MTNVHDIPEPTTVFASDVTFVQAAPQATNLMMSVVIHRNPFSLRNSMTILFEESFPDSPVQNMVLCCKGLMRVCCEIFSQGEDGDAQNSCESSLSQMHSILTTTSDLSLELNLYYPLQYRNLSIFIGKTLFLNVTETFSSTLRKIAVIPSAKPRFFDG